MAPDSELHRALGHLEGTLEGIRATLDRVDKRSAARDETLGDLASRMEAMESHAARMTEVAGHVSNLQQFVRDGKMQGKGILLGFGLATAAGGATLVAFAEQVWLSLFGA